MSKTANTYFVRAAIIYICASVLLVACGKSNKNTEIKRGRPQILSQQEAVEKQIVTGAKAESGADFVYLMSSDTPDGIARYILSTMNTEQTKKSLELSKKIEQLVIARNENGIEARVKYIKDEKKSETIQLVFNLGSIEELRAQMSSAPTVKDGDFGLSLKCLYSDCHVGVVELNHNDSKSFFYISLFEADVKILDQRVSAEQAVTLEKGLKKHPLSAVLEKPSYTAVSNTINVLTGDSAIWVGFGGEAPVGQPVNLEASGVLVNIDNNAVKSIELEALDNRKLIKKADLLSHKKDGELQLKFLLVSENDDQNSEKKANKVESSARYITISVKPKLIGEELKK